VFLAPSAARGADADSIPEARLTPRQRIERAEDARGLGDGVLARALADADAALRRRAALAVGRLQDTLGTPLLLPLLHDADPEVRREAVFALGQIGLAHPATAGSPAAARAPLEAMATGADVASTELVLEALGKLGDRATTPFVVRFLGHADPALRGAAALALWRLSDSTALDPLLERLDDADATVRWRALYALERIMAPERIVLLAAMHVDDADALVRAYAVRTLGRQKSPEGTAYVLQKLADPDMGVAVNAMRALTLIADSTCGGCLPALTGALAAADPYRRVTAATALAERYAWVAADSAARAAALDSLLAGLRDPDAATRGACARALLAQRGAAALPEVRALLMDGSAYVRVEVLDALGALPAEAAEPLLVARLERGTQAFDRATAAGALGVLRSVGGTAPLRSALADSADLVVASAAEALAARGDSAALPALTQAFVAHADEAAGEARGALLEAVATLAGRARADSLDRAHPAPSVRPVYDEAFFAAPTARGAVLHTSRGDIEWAFESEAAPQTVKNFVRLAERGYFNGLRVHRVVPNFVVQDGDPTGTGSGGPGYTIRCEYNRLHYGTGAVGMALSGKDTGGSQWFITHSPQPHLDGRYTIFARVVRGQDVVGRIVQGDLVGSVEILP
jgi:cyclophilin family peptidyl-prolyl cis-trans isomerase/HEAT repeat protein